MFRHPSDFEKLTKNLGYRFNNKTLLLQALTRTSALNESRQHRNVHDFQRLEFIGDKVLNLVVSDILMQQHPTWQEGKLTQEAAKLVNNNGPLAEVARSLTLDKCLIMGLGEEFYNQARNNEKVLSDATEALIGAIWLDSEHNYELMKQFIAVHFGPLGLCQLADSYELMEITYDIDDEEEQLKAVKKWLAKPMTTATLKDAIRAYLLYLPHYVKLALEKRLLRQEDLDELLVESFHFANDENGKNANENLEAIELLLQYNANANVNYKGNSLLYSAIKYGCSLGSIELLLKYKADVNWCFRKVRRLKENLESNSIQAYSLSPDIIEQQDSCTISHLQFFEFLKYKNARYERVEDLNTSLHTVAKKRYLSDYDVELFLLLIKYKGKINQQNKKCETPLHLICQNLYPGDLLSFNFHTGDDYNPLPAVKLIHYLIDNQSNLKLQDENGDTALHILLKKWIKLRAAITLNYNPNLFSSNRPNSIDLTRIFLPLCEKFVLAGCNLELTNKAKKTINELASSIIIMREELELIKDEEFLQCSENPSKQKYTLAEIMMIATEYNSEKSEEYSMINYSYAHF